MHTDELQVSGPATHLSEALHYERRHLTKAAQRLNQGRYCPQVLIGSAAQESVYRGHELRISLQRLDEYREGLPSAAYRT